MTKIIKEYFIPIDLKFHYENSKDDIFNIKESSFKEKDKDNEGKIIKYEKKNKVKLCMNIKQFFDYFPNLVNYQGIEKIDIFEIQTKLQIPRQIRNYMDIIKNKLKNNKLSDIEKIMDKIYDYIIDNIYYKIYKKCVSLKWLQPNNYVDDIKDDLFGIQENEIIENLKLFEREKSIMKKSIIIFKFYKLICLIPSIPKINMSDTERDVDFTLPWIYYFSIKSQPLRMYSNLRFFELYKRGNNYRIESLLSQFKSCSEAIPKINYHDLINVSFEEFQKKCEDSSKI